MRKKLISKIFMYLIISLVFIIPMNIANASEDQSLSSIETAEQVSSTCSITPPINVKDSLILSIVTLCLPGVIEKLMEWKEVKCEAAVCSYEAVKNNLDPTFCKKQASYKTCKYIMGEVFSITPLGVLDYLRDVMAGLLANPIGMAWGIGAKIARNQVDAACSKGISATCSSTTIGSQAVFLAITDILAVYETFMGILENGLNILDFSSDSKCDEISEIKEELSGLVENG